MVCARDEKVADNWRKEVRAKIRSMQHRELWAVDRSGIREVRVGDYKHKVVYRLHGNAIEIVAIAHASRNPRYWKRRLKKNAVSFKQLSRFRLHHSRLPIARRHFGE